LEAVNTEPLLTLYYDGSCPLCRAEIEYMAFKDRQGLLAFVDITTAGSEIERMGLSCERAMQLMQGRLRSGQVIEGVPVFAAAYRLLGLRFLAWLLSRNALQRPLAFLYLAFAKRRHRLSSWLGPLALGLSRRITRRDARTAPSNLKP
jgi:predicted DCC family thiol-disulfide oxidoreductase YuxK